MVKPSIAIIALLGILFGGSQAQAAEPAVRNLALLVAAEAGDAAAVGSMLDAGADINAQRLEGFTPLSIAAMVGNVEVVRLLIERRADVNALSRNAPTTALIAAAAGGQAEAVRLLIAGGANVGVKDNFERTALHYAAGYRSIVTARTMVAALEKRPVVKPKPAHYLETIQVLLDAGAQVNAIARDGMTPLHWASSQDSGRLAVVRLLVSKGADVNAAANDGMTPLMHAASETEVLDLLIAHGANINARATGGLTPLMLVVNNFSPRAPEIARALLDRGADLNARADDGRTALTIVADRRFTNSQFAAQSVRLLIERGADVNAIDKAGLTALQHAPDKCDNEIVVLLKKAGATGRC